MMCVVYLEVVALGESTLAWTLQHEVQCRAPDLEGLEVQTDVARRVLCARSEVKSASAQRLVQPRRTQHPAARR